MWYNDDSETLSDKPLRRSGAPNVDPLEEALSRLAAKERGEIAEIVRREIERPVPTKADSN